MALPDSGGNVLILKERKVVLPAGIDWNVARRIMGANCFGPRVVAQHLGVILSGKKLEAALLVPFYPGTLINCRHTHVLFLGVSFDKEGNPLTIARLGQVLSHEKEIFLACGWYQKEEFANLPTLDFGWYLVSKTILEESREENFKDQVGLLGENEYRGSALLYTYLMLMMWRDQSRRIFENDFVWCSDISSSRYHVMAGGNDIHGPKINHGWHDETRHSHVGLAPVIRPEIQ